MRNLAAGLFIVATIGLYYLPYFITTDFIPAPLSTVLSFFHYFFHFTFICVVINVCQRLEQHQLEVGERIRIRFLFKSVLNFQ
jgi:hypothetical protein